MSLDPTRSEPDIRSGLRSRTPTYVRTNERTSEEADVTSYLPSLTCGRVRENMSHGGWTSCDADEIRATKKPAPIEEPA